MAIGRAEVMEYLRGELTELATEACISLEDTQGGVRNAVDRTFLELGVAYSALPTASVADTLYPAACEVSSYFVLRKIANIFARRCDTWTEHPSPEQRRSQQFKQVSERLLETARKAAQGYGYLVTSEGSANMARYGTLLLDNLEPEPEA